MTDKPITSERLKDDLGGAYREVRKLRKELIRLQDLNAESCAQLQDSTKKMERILAVRCSDLVTLKEIARLLCDDSYDASYAMLQEFITMKERQC